MLKKLLNFLRKHWFELVFALILIVAGFLRFTELDLKPMHHDEGEEIHLFIKPLLNNQSLNWDYDNKGLFYHYLSIVAIKLFSLNLATLRFTPALFGLLAIGLLYFFKNQIGKLAVIFSAMFFCLSPILTYYSRQYTAWPFFDFFLLLLILVFLKFWQTKSKIFLYLLAVVLAILLNLIFEATIIFIIIFAAYLYCRYLFEPDFKITVKEFLTKITYKNFLSALGLLVLAFIFIQSAFLTNINNLLIFPGEFIKIFSKASTTGHNKGMLYYFSLLYPYDLGLLIFGLLGVFYLKNKPFVQFISFWSILSLALFSLIPYKTNWTMMFIILPLPLLAGITVAHVFESLKKYRLIFYAGLTLLFCLSLFYCLNQNFSVVNDLSKNKIGYVETTLDIDNLLAEIDEYENLHPQSKILVSAESYWPLPEFFDNYAVWYIGDITALDLTAYADYNVFLINSKQLSLPPENFIIKDYQLRQNYWVQLLLRK